MEFSRELLFFFSALGAFNGLVLSLYFLFFAKPKHISSKFLGAFLLMMSIRIGKSVFFYFNTDLSFHYLQFGLTACFFIGPFLYFYIKSVVNPESSIKSNWKYHILILLPIALIFGFTYPFEHNVKLWQRYVLNIIYFQWFIYTAAAAYAMRGVFIKLIKKESKLNSLDIWLLNIVLGNTIILISYYSFDFTYYIVGALTFSFLFYLLLLFLFFNKKKRSIIFNRNQKYHDKKIESEEAIELVRKLEEVMKEEELYKNANLKSSDVAKKIQVTTHQFSQLLNDNLGKNFSLFVNEYRITEAQNIIQNNNNLTLEAIGYECGFNSKSTFFTTFKKLAGKTPAQFKKDF